MAENIDVLTPCPDDCPFFVVDTTTPGVKSVQIQDTGGTIGTYRYMRRAGGYRYLFTKDNFTILSLGFILPESFTLATVPSDASKASCFAFNIALRRAAVPATYAYIDQLGATGIQVPLENYEMPYGLYVDMTATPYAALTDTKFAMTFDLAGLIPYVSMISVPAALHGTTQRVIPFMKIQHNMTLTASYP